LLVEDGDKGVRREESEVKKLLDVEKRLMNQLSLRSFVPVEMIQFDCMPTVKLWLSAVQYRLACRPGSSVSPNPLPNLPTTTEAPPLPLPYPSGSCMTCPLLQGETLQDAHAEIDNLLHHNRRRRDNLASAVMVLSSRIRDLCAKAFMHQQLQKMLIRWSNVPIKGMAALHIAKNL